MRISREKEAAMRLRRAKKKDSRRSPYINTNTRYGRCVRMSRLVILLIIILTDLTLVVDHCIRSDAENLVINLLAILAQAVG